MTGLGSISVMRHSMRPASILARSRISLISRVSRSLSLMMMLWNSLRCPTAMSGVSCRISANERIEVSGVRSSWLTVEMKSSLSRSSSCRRSLAARSSAVAASSLAEFSSSRRVYSMTCEVSSRISMTCSMPGASSVTTEPTMTRADAAPTAPASSRSANCTSSASAALAAVKSSPRLAA